MTQRARLTPLLLLAFASGALALGYEIAWFQRLAKVWGSSSVAVSAVSGSFVSGLGIGSFVASRFLRKARYPLLVLGCVELVIGVWGYLIACGLGEHIGRLLAVLCRPDTAEESHTFATRLLESIAMLWPPAALMGTTLPLLARWWEQRRLGTRANMLLSANTFGACAGACIVGLVLLPRMGLERTGAVLLAGSVALGIAGSICQGLGGPEDHIPSCVPEGARLGYRGAVALLGCTAWSCASIGFQSLWTRQVSLAIGGTSHTYVLLLGVVLLGNAGGVMLSQAIAPRLATRGIGIAFAVTAGAFCLESWLLPHLCRVAGVVGVLRSGAGFDLAFCSLVVACTALIPSLATGVVCGCVVRLESETLRHSEVVTLGRLAGFTSMGGVVGGGVVPVCLLPALGVRSTGAALTATQAVAVVAMTCAGHRLLRGWTLLPVGIAVVAVTVALRTGDSAMENLGMYMYGLQAGASRTSQSYFAEGASCNVLVTRSEGHVALRVNGKVDASTGLDMAMQVGLGLFGSLYARPGGESLAIGYGSGTTCGVALMSGCREVTCCEIEPTVFGASSEFGEVNGNVHRDPRLRMVFDDARSYIASTARSFDAVLSEPSNPWCAGVSALFTLEFYETVRRRLREDGVLCQWLQTYSLSPGDVRMVLRTLGAVFPWRSLWRMSSGDFLVICGKRPFGVGREQLARLDAALARSEGLRALVLRAFGARCAAELVAGTLVCDERVIKELEVDGGRVAYNTDDNMRLEYEATAKRFTHSGHDVERDLLRRFDQTAWRGLAEAIEATESIRSAARARVKLLEHLGLDETARAMAAACRGVFTDDSWFAARACAAGDEEFTKAVRSLASSEIGEANAFGLELSKRGSYADAAVVFQEVVAVSPSASGWKNLSWNQEQAGHLEDAFAALEQAMRLDALDGSLEPCAARIRARLGRPK